MTSIVSRLPTVIARRIFVFLIDSAGINPELSEDIKHYIKCRSALRTAYYLYASDHILTDLIAYMRKQKLTEKYNRQYRMYLIFTYDNGNLPEAAEDEFEYVQKLDIFEYARKALTGCYIFDNRINKYSILPTAVGTEDEDYSTQRDIDTYRVLNHIVCMMEPEDRAAAMSHIEHYAKHVLPFEEDDHYQEEYYGEDDYDNDY